VLPIVVALAVWATPSFAQQLVCQPIRRGESAAAAARRVTGDSRNTYRASFQIMNAASRFVPKSQYERIRAGWRACVVKTSVRHAASVAARPDRLKAPELVDVVRKSVAPVELTATVEDAVAAAPAAAQAPLFVRIAAPSAPSDAPRTASGRDFTWVWLGGAVAAPWFFLQALDVHRRRTSTASVLVQHFANRFISEFERPLVLYDGTERPLQSHVRCARRGRFDILLAPGTGRRYPNLADHKRNVEYDVARVMDVLGDDAFVSGELSMQDEWVVVPFQPKTAPKHPKIT
jgi:hypothetical protein